MTTEKPLDLHQPAVFARPHCDHMVRTMQDDVDRRESERFSLPARNGCEVHILGPLIDRASAFVYDELGEGQMLRYEDLISLRFGIVGKLAAHGEDAVLLVINIAGRSTGNWHDVLAIEAPYREIHATLLKARKGRESIEASPYDPCPELVRKAFDKLHFNPAQFTVAVHVCPRRVERDGNGHLAVGNDRFERSLGITWKLEVVAGREGWNERKEHNETTRTARLTSRTKGNCPLD
ncbi:hypothetical protein C8D95_11344 [Silicimonas algicola]|uniref:Uncharacterized protein n=1 Tax=Silicimonas algicola TaxID=1826607 RepID=A0A316FY49_9RHOB|nr:hypothetical protein C8D95_11344 [Silicimonas algicola]